MSSIGQIKTIHIYMLRNETGKHPSSIPDPDDPLLSQPINQSSAAGVCLWLLTDIISVQMSAHPNADVSRHSQRPSMPATSLSLQS